METTTEKERTTMHLHRKKIQEFHSTILARKEAAALHQEQTVKPAVLALRAAEQGVKEAEAAKLVVADAARKVLQSDFSQPHEVTEARQKYAAAENAVTVAKKRAEEASEHLRLVSTAYQGRMYVDQQTERAHLLTDVYAAELEDPEVAVAMSRIGRLYAVRKEIFLSGHHPISRDDFMVEMGDKIRPTITADEVLAEWLGSSANLQGVSP